MTIKLITYFVSLYGCIFFGSTRKYTNEKEFSEQGYIITKHIMRNALQYCI